MRTVKKYQQGGFFGNSFEKFEDMPGSEKTGSMFDKNRFGFGTKGGALRREKRYLKKLEGQDALKGGQADRLEYLRKVQKDRAKKGIAAGALAAGAAFGAPAALGAIQGAGGLSGIAGSLATKMGGKGLLKQAGKLAMGNLDKIQGLNADQNAQLDQDINQELSNIESKGKYGMKVRKKRRRR